MHSVNVTLRGPFDQKASLWLKTQIPELVVLSPEDNMNIPISTEVLIIRSNTHVDRSLMDKLPQLKTIITATSGTDHIDIQSCKERNIEIENTPDANTFSASELTWTLVLATAKRLKFSDKAFQQKSWKKNFPKGIELFGKTYGIIGLGRIGKRVALMAQAFGMNLLAYDPYIEQTDFTNCGVQPCSFEEVFKGSDVVSLHVPLTPETKNMVNKSTLLWLSPETILINTSRGGIVDEMALLQSLESRQLNYVALDVFATEPLPDTSPLLKFKDLWLTPHVGAWTEEAFSRSCFEAAQKTINIYKKKESICPQ